MLLWSGGCSTYDKPLTRARHASSRPKCDLPRLGFLFADIRFVMGYDGPNYTQTPNLFLDEHLPDMGHAETKVVLAIIRQTFGWHKRKDRLSISRLMELTGLSNRAVIDGTQAALERGVIGREKEGDSYCYWLVVEGGEDTSQGGVSEVHRGCEDTSQQGVSEVHTQKKTKETHPKESAPAREDDPAGVQAWVDVTGERPTAQTRQMLRDELNADDAPTWDAAVFRDVLKEAWLNVGRDAHRIRVGYLLSSYEQALARKRARDGGRQTPRDGKVKGPDQMADVEYNARGYRIQ